MRYLVVLLTLTNISITSAQIRRSPSNITRTVGEMDIFIPCPFEFSSSPPIWRINGTDYSSTTLQSIYSQTFGGLFINEVTHCLDQTTFQCIDTSSAGLVGQESSVGVLSVVPQGICDGDISSALEDDLELNHRLMEYTNANITLAWEIFSETANCSISQLQSCPQPNTDSINVNITTIITSYTIQSEQLHTPEGLEALTISSLSDPPGMNCPSLGQTIKFNVSETNNVPVLLSNNYCSCIEIPCERDQGTLHVAITIPGENDIICVAALSISDLYLTTDVPCYDVRSCSAFNTQYSYPPFFRICENPIDNSKCSICFKDLKNLNKTRLDFFYLQRDGVNCAEFLFNRLYFKSVLLHGVAGTANFTLDTTSGQICFSSLSQDCEHTSLTLYNFSITDITGNVVFNNETSVPESTCVTLGRPFLPQCSPFLVFVQPINDNIEYKSITEKVYIPADADESSEVCSCLNKTTELNLAARELPQISSVVIDYSCSSLYLTPITITIIISGGMSAEYRVICENGSITVNNSGCDITFNISGGWTFTNRSTPITCPPLLLTEFTTGPCPTTSPAPDNNNGQVAAIVTITTILVFVILVLVVVVVVVVVCCCHYKYRQCFLPNCNNETREYSSTSVHYIKSSALPSGGTTSEESIDGPGTESHESLTTCTRVDSD